MNKRRIKVNIISKIILILVLFISVFINIENVSAATKEAYLTTGEGFNNKLNKNVTGALRKATLAEYNAATSTSVVSTDDSPYPVYVWSDGTDILYYTEAEKMYMNENSYRMFSDLKVTSIDLSDFDSSLVTNMNDLFERYKGTSIDVSNLNTSNVTTMYGVFWGAENLETIEGLENFDTRNVTSMSEMFYYCESLKTIEGLENFDTSNVTNMNRMFYSCTSLEEIDLSSFDTSASPSVHSMFEDAKSLRSVYVSNKWDNTKLGDSTNMFEHTQNLIGYYGFAFVQGGNSTYHDKTYARADTEDPNNRGFFTDVSHKGEMNTVTYPDGTVEVYPHNSKIDIPTNDGSKPNEKVAEITFKYHDDITADTTMDVEKVYYQNGWYVNNEHYWNGTRLVVGENLLLEYCFGENIARVESFPRPEREGYSFVGWWTDEYGGERIYNYAETEDITLHAHWSDPFAELDTGYNFNNKINGISHTDEYGDAKYFRKATEEEYNNLDKDTLDDYYNIISNEDSGELIYAWNAGESVLYYSKTDNILMNEDSSYMFSYSTFEEIDLSGLDPSNVTNMEDMFQECSNLTNIVFGDNFDTSNVTNMHNMFTGCYALQSVDFSKLDTSNVTDMSYMFYNCDSLTTFNFDDLDTSSVTDMSYMFAYDYALTTVDMSKANLSSLTNAGGMFYYCTSLSDFTFTRRLTSNITDITGMFEGCSSLEELSLVSLDTSNIQYISSMFYGMTNLRTIYVSDYWNTSNMEYSDYVFYEDENLVGEKGTTFDSDHIDVEYAIVDDAPDHPGYLTHADVYTVYYPDGSIELYRDGETLTLGVDNYTDSCSSVLHVWLDYNIGDGGDPAPTDVCVNSTGNGWIIDNVHYDDGDTLTVHNDIHVAYDTTESVYFLLPQNVEHEDWEFLGWYVGDTKWEKEYFDELADAMFVAHWNTGGVKLTIDGDTQYVEPGYVYTVPNANPDPYAPVNNKIHIHLYYMDEEDTQKDVVISEGYSIGYQIINGDTYYPGDTYVVNDETEVVSIYDWNGQYAMDPYIKEPTRDGYIFMGWQLYNWEYYDVSDINVDIYSIEPYYTWFDGASFYAEWQEEPDPDEYVVVRYKDFIKKQDYKKIYPKGYVYTFKDLTEDNSFDVEIRNNVNDDTATVTYTTHITSNSYAVKIVGSDDESWRNSSNWYHPGDTYEINEDIEIEVLASAYTDNSHYNGGCSGDAYLCELAYDAADNSKYNNYIFRGVYTEENGQGAKINPNVVTNNNTYYGSHNGFNTLWVYLEEVDENSVIVTVDGEVFIMPKGEGTIPSPSITSETMNYIITYKFNNGDPDVLGIDTVRYYIGSLDYNGDEYQLGDTFDFEEDTTFGSNWESEPIGDGLLEVNDEHFLGWFDENDNQVTSLDDIDDNITLYAHWDYPDVNVTLEGVTDTVPYGFTYDLAEFKNHQSTVDAGTITFHDESGNYEGEVWTTSAQRTPSKAYINGVEYELDGEYTFIEDTVIEFEYEFEFTDEELPRDKSIMGREHYTFGGWYDNPDYEGDPITKYSGMNNIDVYAKWIGEEVIVIINEDESNPLIYHYGDTYTFGDLPESFVWDMGNEIFDFNDGVTPNSTQHLIMTIYPDTWFYYGYDENGEHVENTYNVGDTATLYGETWIDVGSEDDNNYVYSGVTIPDNPEREHYTFDGWYTEWDYKVTNINELDGFDQVITAKWIGEDVTVHLPDEDITVEYGKEYPTYENNYPKANTEESEVTFKYHDGETDDLVRYVEKSYTPNGWLINDVHYGEDTIVFTEETTLVPDYAETVIPVEFPSDPTWFRHDFDGWFTEETGGEQVTSYSDLIDTELHAHWHDHMAIITTPDGDVQVDENKQFTFPTNNIPKDSTKPGIVTFDPQNGEVPIKNDIIKIYTPNGWLLDGVHYDDGETITVLDDSTITPDYTETISVEYPTDPVKTYYTFKGWYSAMNGGDKVENYNETESITLYAHYYQTNPDGEEYILPSEHPEKPTETLATVTFDPHNGDPVTTSTVTKKWIAKGWLVDGELHYNGDIIYKTPDTVIEPNYTYVIVPAQFPIAPTRGNERYTGWFTEETGGEQVKRYSGTENITLHAQYTDSYAILKTGREVNNIMQNRRPYSFKPATYEEYQTVTTTTIISTDDSPYPVYFWVSSTGAHYYSDADVIYFNEDSNYFFAFNYYNLCDIDLSKMNSSYVTDFGYFFWGACSTGRGTLPLNQLDTSNGINFSYMFDGTGMSSFDFSNFNTSRATNMNVFLSNNDNLTSLDLTPLDTSHVTDMHYMFSGNDKMTSYDLSNWDTSNVEDMSMMFSYNNSLVSLDLSSFDTRNATSIGALVSECPKLESINLSSFNTSNVTNMYAMFKNDKSLKELDLSSFDTSKVTTTQEMFRDATSLEKIWVSDKWDMSSVTSGNNAFLNDTNIIGQRGTTYEPLRRHGDNSTNSGAFIDEAPDRPGYLWNKYATKYVITLPDGIEEVYEGAPFVVPTNTYPKNLEIEYTITFDPMNGEEVITSNKMKTYEPVGFTDGENVYESGSTIYVTGDMTLTPYYNEVVVEPDFPEDPVKTGNKFEGWYTEGGDKVETLENIDDDITLYAHWSESLPTDFDVDSENITMVVGDTHQIVVTFTPDGTEDIITYTGYDNEKINIVDGLITAITKGETTITIGTENTDIEKTITVTIVSDKLESDVYDVREEDIDAGKDRVIVGAEPLTTIGEFKDNLLNPNEYIKIYDSEGNELEDDEEVRTGLVIKLEYGSNVVDEAIMVIRGDIDGDGVVSLADYMAIINHYVEIEEITSYPFFLAADVDEDEILNMADALKLMNYYAEIIDTLND